MTIKNDRNSVGLYDAPVHSDVKLSCSLSADNLKTQLEQGAFFMSREEAERNGFLNPYSHADVATVDLLTSLTLNPEDRA